MPQYTIVSQGDPIIPYTLSVTFPVNCSASYVEGMTTTLSPESQEFIDLMQSRAVYVEDVLKQQSFFSVQDTSRNVTWSTSQTAADQHDLTISFTIENAEATIPREAQSELTGQALDDYLLSQSSVAEYDFFYERNWIPL